MPAPAVKIERRSFSTGFSVNEAAPETRADGDDNTASALPGIQGYTAIFGIDTEINSWFGSFKERIQKGAFRRAIREGQDVRALRNHEPDNLLGRTAAKTLRLKEDDTGLHIEIDTPDTTIGRDTVESIRRGDLSGMSFAFIVRAEKWINGKDGEADLRIIQDVDLYDVGPVTYPAYTQTTANLRENSELHKAGLMALGKEVPEVASMEDEQEREDPVRLLNIDQSSDEPLVNERTEEEKQEEEKKPTEETPTENKVADYARRLMLVRAQKANVDFQLTAK